MTMEMKLATDVTRRLDAHLDAVDKALGQTGLARAERRQITDDLQAQILDMLEKRVSEAPTLADLEAVLVELDPPEAYAESAEEPELHAEFLSLPVFAGPTRFSRRAIIGALWAPLFILLLAIPWVQALKTDGAQLAERAQWTSTSAAGPHGMPMWIWLALALALSAPFATTTLGLMAVSDIRHSRGAVTGLPLALFDALLFPLALLSTLVYFLMSLLLETQAATLDRGTGTSLAALLTVAADGLLVWWACSAANTPVAGRPLPSATAPQMSRRAIQGSVFLGIALVVGGIFLLQSMGRVPNTQEAVDLQRSKAYIGLAVLAIGCLPSLVLGVLALGEIRRSQGRLMGIPLALVDVLLVPLGLLSFMFCGCMFMILRSVVPGLGEAATWSVCFLTTMILDGAAVVWAWKLARRPAEVRQS